MEPNSPKKIQFAVPLFQSQIDPEAAEQRRRSLRGRDELLLADMEGGKMREGTSKELHEAFNLSRDIRKRRPTPASLVIMNEHSPPEIDEKRKNNSQGESQNASPKQRKQSVYTPPAIKENIPLNPVLKPLMSMGHRPLTSFGIRIRSFKKTNPNYFKDGLLKRHVSSSEQADSIKYNGNHHASGTTQQQRVTEADQQPMKPRRKDTPFQHQPPFVPGVKHLKSQNDSAFPEEEEGINEREEEWGH